MNVKVMKLIRIWAFFVVRLPAQILLCQNGNRNKELMELGMFESLSVDNRLGIVMHISKLSLIQNLKAMYFQTTS